MADIGCFSFHSTKNITTLGGRHDHPGA
ncbi:hypothetical protein [Streptomyces sp. Tu 2975]